MSTRHNMKKLSLILVILWMILIFVFSHQEASISSSQSDFFVNIVTSVVGNKYIDVISFIIRKCAHFFLYFILGILVINMCRYYNPKNIVILSLLICMLYACSDELHQLFISGRSCELRDALIDSIGSILGIYSYKVVRK